MSDVMTETRPAAAVAPAPAVKDKPNGAAKAEGEAAPRPAPTLAEVVLDAIGLMAASPSHRHIFLADLEWLLLPPVRARQVRLVHVEGRPIGLLAWAKVSDEVDARLAAGNPRLAPKEWTSGENTWVMMAISAIEPRDKFIERVGKQILGENFKVFPG